MWACSSLLLIRTPRRLVAAQRLMQEAGFERVQRMDGRFFQPVLVGHKPRVT